MTAEAIVLAGGLGTRLGALTAGVPKPMVPIRGRPFLCFVLDYLVREGISRIILSVGYLHEAIEAFFGTRYRDTEIIYAVEDEPLGTGGALRLALSLAQTDLVLVLNGDTIFPVPVRFLVEAQQRLEADLVMALKRVTESGRFGRIELDAGRVTSFMEKSGAGAALINGGVYLVRRERILAHLPRSAGSLERDVLPGLVRSHVIAGVIADA